MLRWIPILFLVLIYNAEPLVAFDNPKDFRLQPFSANSPWNYPIGSKAIYEVIPGLPDLSIGLNYDGRWTTAIYSANENDRVGKLYFNQETWQLLDGGMKNRGNPPRVEERLRSKSSPDPLPANPYSTVIPGSSEPVWPADYHKADAFYYSRTFRIPPSAYPSPDSDSLIAIYQPNGWVLDAYGAIVLSNGDIVCMAVSYIDARGEGTGWSNGRRASMIPSFAGLIRDGEITSGAIRHALACQMSPTVLREEAMWPAYAFDMNASYSGSIPMGALLAVPPQVNINNLGLTAQGKVLALAMQNFGVYIVDRGGSGGMTLLADLKARDIRWKDWQNDLNVIKPYLKWVSNNSATNLGGGGTNSTVTR
jgi:hypothetical protein